MTEPTADKKFPETTDGETQFDLFIDKMIPPIETQIKESFSGRGYRNSYKNGVPIPTGDTFGEKGPFFLEKSGYSNAPGRELMYVTSGELRGAIINRLSPFGAYAWVNLVLGVPRMAEMFNPGAQKLVVPVARILPRNGIQTPPQNLHDLKFRPRGGDIAVSSAFCGLSVGQTRLVLERAREFLAWRHDPLSGEVVERLRFLSETIEELADKAYEDMEYMGFNYGAGKPNPINHRHKGNLTVEFVQSGYLADMLAKGYNINTLPFNKDKISFSIGDWLKRPDVLSEISMSRKYRSMTRGDGFTPIVRLIDFDFIGIQSDIFYSTNLADVDIGLFHHYLFGGDAFQQQVAGSFVDWCSRNITQQSPEIVKEIARLSWFTKES